MTFTPADTRELIERAGDFDATVIGTASSDYGGHNLVELPRQIRFMHTLNLGATGEGKTTLLMHAALQDIYAGYGVCVLTPKGSAVDELVGKLPEDRLDDVIYINPNRQRVPRLNVLSPTVTDSMTEAEVANQQELIVSNLTAIFRRLSDGWGARIGGFLETLLRVHVQLNTYRDRDDQYTLADVFDCIVEEDEITDRLDRIDDRYLYEQLLQVRESSRAETEPLERRFKDFVQNPTIRRLVTHSASTVDLREAVQNGKIVLIDVNKGRLGDTTAQLVGSIVLTELWAGVQSRIDLPADERTPFFAYIDEAHAFSGEATNLQTILAEAREYRLGCWLADQHLHQLPGPVRQAVKTNARTKIVFNPEGEADIGQLASLFNGLDQEALTRLGGYHCAVQYPGTDAAHGTKPKATICQTLPPYEYDHDAVEDRITQLCQRHPRPSRGGTGTGTGPKGPGDMPGGTDHDALLNAAQRHFYDHGITVHKLQQDVGKNRPDGRILFDGGIAHLEAECTTLDKPAKVLRNLQNAAAQDRPCVFVVQAGDGDRLQAILEDPVSRYGVDSTTADGEDADGYYKFYRVEGEPVTALDAIAETPYAIFEAVQPADGDAPTLRQVAAHRTEPAGIPTPETGTTDAPETGPDETAPEPEADDDD